MNKRPLGTKVFDCSGFTSFVFRKFGYTLSPASRLQGHNELYLKDNSKQFDKIVYVGDYFEYIQLQSFVKRDVEYNNFGYIKLFIDKTKFQNEYKKIINYASDEDLFVEEYDDMQEFINESKEEDFSVVYGDTETLNTARKKLQGEMLFNAFPFNDYKFRVNRQTNYKFLI